MKIHINQLRSLLKRFYRNVKDISPPFLQEEAKEFEEFYNVLIKELKERDKTNVRS